jgi:hypothetical protein
MKVAIEIVNGTIDLVYADGPCEVVIIHRDELVERTLPDGDQGYASICDASVDAEAVEEAFDLAV